MASREAFSGAGRTANPLRARRLALGLTIAELEHRSGVDNVTIWRAEHDHGRPARSTRLLLAAALRSPVDELFPDDDAGRKETAADEPGDGRPHARS